VSVVRTDSPEEFRAKLAKLGEAIKADPNVYIEDLKVTADTVHRTVLINGETRKDSGDLKFGVEHEGHTGDGRPVKVIQLHLIGFCVLLPPFLARVTV